MVLRRLTIIFLLLSAVGLWDVWLNAHNPVDRFRSSFYGSTPGSIVVPLGATGLLCIVIGILTLPTLRKSRVASVWRRVMIIVLAVGAAEGVVLGAVSLFGRSIDVVPIDNYAVLRGRRAGKVHFSEVRFSEGSIEGWWSFCTESKTAKRIKVKPKYWGGFNLWCMYSTGRLCPPGQVNVGVGVAVPFWFLSGLLSVYPVVVFLRGPMRRRRRRKRGQCLRCGYNLTGNISGVCPECGSATTT